MSETMERALSVESRSRMLLEWAQRKFEMRHGMILVP